MDDAEGVPADFILRSDIIPLDCIKKARLDVMWRRSFILKKA